MKIIHMVTKCVKCGKVKPCRYRSATKKTHTQKVCLFCCRQVQKDWYSIDANREWKCAYQNAKYYGIKLTRSDYEQSKKIKRHSVASKSKKELQKNDT